MPIMPAPIYDPTPAEIKKLCEEIQKTWTDEVRRTRAGGSFAEPILCLDLRYRIRGTHEPQSDLTTREW